MLEVDRTIRSDDLSTLIEELIPAEDILIQVSWKLENLKPRAQVILDVHQHVGKSQIRITSRDFHGEAVI